MSLFRWLEHQEVVEEKSTKMTSESVIPSERSIDDHSENGSKIDLGLNDSTTSDRQEKPFSEGKEFKELRTKFKEFFITYHDRNVKSFEGEELS